MVGVDNVPNELLPRFFDDCDIRELVVRSRVSKRWKSAACEHPTFWRTVQLLAPIGRVDDGLPLFKKRLYYRLAQPVDVSATRTSNAALDAISDNLHRMTSLQVSNDDEGLVLWALSYPAPALESLEISGSSRTRRPHLPRNFLGGHAPRLTSVTLFNTTCAFATPGTACFPSVRTVCIEHGSAVRGDYVGTVMDPNTIQWAIPLDALDRLSAMFPRMQSLKLKLLAFRLQPRQQLPGFPAARPSEQTAAVLGRLREFQAEYCAAAWSTLQHIPLQEIRSVKLTANALEQDALHACVPPREYAALVSIWGDELGLIELSSSDRKLKRTLVLDMDAAYSVDTLGPLIAHQSWRVVALSINSIAWEALLAIPVFGFSALMTLRIEVPDPYWFAYEVKRERDEMSILPMQALSLLIVESTQAKEGCAWSRSELESYLVDLEFVPQGVTLAMLGVALQEDVSEAERTAFLRETYGPSGEHWLETAAQLIAGLD